MNQRWWDRRPEDLHRELGALDASGFQWAKDEEAFASGRLIVTVQAVVQGTARQLVAYYPDTFPYFAPQVQMRGAKLPRHHNLEGGLCLLANDCEDWQPCVDTLATVLTSQLKKIEHANNVESDPDAVADDEEAAGEPISNFLQYALRAQLLIPDATPSPEVPAGRLDIGLHPGARGNGVSLGGIRRVLDGKGRMLLFNPLLPPEFSGKADGFWCRLPHRPQIDQVLTHEALLQTFHGLITQHCPELEKALDASSKGRVLFGALVYPDEVSWRDSADDWVFLEYTVTRERKGAQGAKFQPQFIRADRSGEKTHLQRAPFLAPLRTKSVLLIGAGNVGSPVALQLARAGVGRLDIVDHDILQAGNTVRWALGRREAGNFKAAILANHISREFPLTKAYPHLVRIGRCAVDPTDTLDVYEHTRALIAAADLVIDGTASYRASHFISDMARSLGKPYVWLTTTHGAAGGVVGRIVPGSTTGCWHCFQQRLTDESIRVPAEAGAGPVQPGGCTHPTFVGAGVDSDEVSILASRLAIATLCRGEDDGYADFSWNVAVGDLKKEAASIAPEWSTYALDVHPGCLACNPPSP